MAINFNNQNQGIDSINLGDFGLQQPEENMTVAEAINFGTLPQAQEKFEPDFGGMLDATRNLGKSYQGTTKADFINAIQSGAFGPGANQMFDRNIGDVFEGVNLEKEGMFSFGGVDPTLKGTTDGSFRNTLDIDRGALSPEALESLPEGFFKGVGDQSSLGLPTNDRLAMAISNYDQLFGPRTMTDANQSLYTGVMDRSGTPIDYTDRIRQQNLPAFASQPQYTIRGQIADDFGEIKNKIGSGLGSIRDFVGSGFNKAKEGIMNSSPINFLRGLPTPGNLLLNMAATRNPLNPRASNYNPTLQGQIDYMKDKGMYGITDQSGLNKITGGRLAGKALVSLFGSNDLGEMYGKDLSKLEGYLESMPRRFSRLRKNNPGSYQNKIDNLNAKIAQNKIEAQEAQAAREAATAARAMAKNPQVYSNAGITSGGFASQNTGTNSNFSNRTGRGRTGYSEGGIASMFTRRG